MTAVPSTAEEAGAVLVRAARWWRSVLAGAVHNLGQSAKGRFVLAHGRLDGAAPWDVQDREARSSGVHQSAGLWIFAGRRTPPGE